MTATTLPDIDARFARLPPEWLSAMQALKGLHGTPEAMSIQIILGAANAVTQRFWDVDSQKYGRRPTNLFLLNMTPTGGRKSTNLREISQPFLDFRNMQKSNLVMDSVRYAMEEKAYKKALKQCEKDLDDGVTPTYPDPVRPVETADYLIGTATLNGIIDTLKSQSWCSLMTSEGGEFFNGHSWQGGRTDAARAVSMSAALTSMWDGHDIQKVTGIEKTTLYNRRINMLILLQEQTVRAVLNNNMFAEQGFLHRILITQCEDPEFREWGQRDDDSLLKAALDPFNARIGAMLVRRPFPGGQPDASLARVDHYQLWLPAMSQDAAAAQVLREFYNHIGSNITGQYQGVAPGFMLRCHEQALRIAATISDFRGELEITEDSALGARDLMLYFIEQRLKLEVGITDPFEDLRTAALRVRQWMQEHPQAAWTRRELGQRIKWFGRLSAEMRDRILEEALRQNFLQGRERRAGTMEFTVAQDDDRLEAGE